MTQKDTVKFWLKSALDDLATARAMLSAKKTLRTAQEIAKWLTKEMELKKYLHAL